MSCSFRLSCVRLVFFCRWRVAKRPGLDDFLKEMAQLYEIVVFTDSLGGLADEASDVTRVLSLRVYGVVGWASFRRSSCLEVGVVWREGGKHFGVIGLLEKDVLF